MELSRAIFRFEENILKEKQNFDITFEEEKTSKSQPTIKRRQDNKIQTRKIAAKKEVKTFLS